MTITEIIGVLIVLSIAFSGVVIFVALMAGKNADRRNRDLLP